MEFRPERSDLARYLEDTELIDWQTPAVVERALSLSEGCDGRTEVVAALFAWVRDEIGHPLETGSELLTCRASHVLRERCGLSFARSHLLVALLRARGMPAGFGYQRIGRDAPETGHVLRGFAAVYLHDAECFAPLDPQRDGAAMPGVAPDLELEHAKVAYEPDAEAGEETYPLIFARPHPAVVDVLSRAPDVRRALKGLPERL